MFSAISILVFLSLLVKIDSNESVVAKTGILPMIKRLCNFYESAIDATNVTIYEYRLKNTCSLSILEIIKSLDSSDESIFRIIDAAGKCPSNFADGAHSWLGSFKECINVNVHKNNNSFTGRYCLSYVKNNFSGFNPYVPRYNDNVWNYGICVPDQCTSQDIQDLTNKVLRILWPQDELLSYVICQQKELPLSNLAIGVLCFCIVFLVMLLFGTLYDLIVYQPFFNTSKRTVFRSIRVSGSSASYEEIKPLLFTSKPMGGSIVDRNSPLIPNILARLFLAFSFVSNMNKILRHSENVHSLSCVYGIKVLSMLWLILGHSYLYSINIFSNPTAVQEVVKTCLFQLVLNAHFAVDSFFLISGLLISYLCLKNARFNEGYINWKHFYFHRFWRLTPIYMLILVLYVSWLPYLGSGPMWPQNGLNNCSSWWTNLLYINNFVYSENMCLEWSWYLPNDMQFYIVSPIFLISLIKWEYFGIGLLFFFLLVTFIASGTISYINHFPPGILAFNQNIPISFHTDSYYLMYIRPYCRMGPYIIGFLLGYMLYKYETRPLIKKKLVLFLLWLSALIIEALVVFGLIYIIKQESLQENFSLYAFYNSCYHSAWAFSVACIIFSCAKSNEGIIYNFLSWKVWRPLANLNYCVYLIHPIILIVFYQSKHNLEVFTHTTVIVYFFATVVLSYGVAFILSIAFEYPLKSLEKVALGKDEWKS